MPFITLKDDLLINTDNVLYVTMEAYGDADPDGDYGIILHLKDGSKLVVGWKKRPQEARDELKQIQELLNSKEK